MDGDEVHRLGHLGVSEPEFPDVGVGDRHPGQGGFDLTDVGGELAAGDFPAEQGFVAHHHRADHGRVLLGQGDHVEQLLGGGRGVAAHPGAQQELHAVLFREIGQGAQPGGRVGAEAGKAAGEEGQVLVEPFVAYGQSLGEIKGRLGADEGGVGNTLQPLVAGHLRLREALRPAGQEPEGKDGGQRQAIDEKAFFDFLHPFHPPLLHPHGILPPVAPSRRACSPGKNLSTLRTPSWQARRSLGGHAALRFSLPRSRPGCGRWPWPGRGPDPPD